MNALRFRGLLGCLIFVAYAFGLSGAAIAYEKEIESLCSSLGSQISSSGKKTIAVVDFTDLQGAVTELGRFLAEEISINLAMDAKGYQVIDRAHLKRLIQEHNLATSDIIDPKTAKQLGRISGVDGLITGTITPFGDSVRLSIKVLDVETANVIGAKSGNIAKTKVIEELLAKEVDVVAEVKKGPKSDSHLTAKAVEMEGFVFKPIKCVRKGGKVVCTVSFYNGSDEDRLLFIVGGEELIGHLGHSSLYDNNGKEYPAAIGMGGRLSTLGGSQLNYSFPRRVPVNVDFIAEGVNADSTKFTASIRIERFKQSVVIRDIPITK